jgi:hypothetical protein
MNLSCLVRQKMDLTVRRKKKIGMHAWLPTAGRRWINYLMGQLKSQSMGSDSSLHKPRHGRYAEDALASRLLSSPLRATVKV